MSDRISNPGYLARNLLRGAAGVIPEGVTGIASLTGWEAARDANERIGTSLDSLFSVPRASFYDSPGAAAAQTLGGAVVGLPARVVGGAYNLLAGTSRTRRAAVGALEAVTPLTLPLTRANVALNAGAGGAINYGMETLVRSATGLGSPLDLDSELGTPLQLDEPRALPPERAPLAPMGRNAEAVSAPLGAPLVLDGDDTGSSAGDAPALGEPINLDAPGNATTRRVLDYVPLAVGGLLATAAGGGALRNYNLARRTDAAAAGGLTAPGPAVLPSVAEPSVAEAATTGLFNNTNAVTQRLREQVEAGNMTQADAAVMQGATELNLNQTIISQRIEESMRTGILPGGARTVPMQQILDRVAAVRAVDPAREDMLNSAMVAANEMDKRNANNYAGRLATQGTGPVGNISQGGAATGLYSETDAMLTARVRALQADPELQGLADDIQRVNADLRNWGVSVGMWSPQDAMNFSVSNPNYIHTLFAETMPKVGGAFNNRSATGVEANSPISGRSYAEGSGAERAQNPFVAQMDAFRQTVQFGIINQTRREILEQLVQQTGNGPQFVGRRLPQSAGMQPGWMGVEVRRNGIREKYEVAPTLATTLDGTPKAAVPVLNGMRQWFQNFTTGPGAAVLGSVFAPTSAAMAGVSTILTRRPGTTAGIIDQAAQAITGRFLGKRHGVRGDGTFALQAGYAVLADFAAFGAEQTAGVLRRSILSNGILARTMGATRADAAAQAAQRAYESSMLHVMRREGAAGSGLAYAPDEAISNTANIRRMSPEFGASLPYGGRAASIGDIRSYDDLRSYVGRQGGRLISPNLSRTWHVVSNLLDIIASSPNSAYFRQNVGRMDITDVAASSRRVSGDPAQFGSSVAMQKVVSASPYLSVTMQSLHNYAKAARANPAAFTLGVATFATMTQAMSIYSAIVYDEDRIAQGLPPEAVQHFLTQPSRDQVGGINVYVPGLNVNLPLRLPYDPVLAPVVAPVRAYMAEAMGLTDPRFFQREFDTLRHSLGTMLEDQAVQGMGTGLSMAGGQLGMPPLVNMFSRVALGVDIGNALDLTNPRIHAPRDTGAPGYEENRLPGDSLNRHVEAVIETATGASAQLFTNLIRNVGMADDPLAASSQGYQLRAQSGSRVIAPLFQQARQLPQSDGIGEFVRPAEDAMTRIVAGIGDVRAAGTIGSGRRRQEPDFGPGRSGVDSEMAPLLQQVAQFSRTLKSQQDARRVLTSQILNAQADGRLRSNPAELRDTINQYVGEIRQINAGIYDRILEFEQMATEQYGRRIRIADIKPGAPASMQSGAR